MAVDLSAISSEDLTPVRRTLRSRNGPRIENASLNSSDLAMFDEVRSSYGCAVDVASSSIREWRSGRNRRQKRDQRRESLSSVVENGSGSLGGRRPPAVSRRVRHTGTSAATRNAKKVLPEEKEDEWREGEEEGGGVVSESVQPGLSHRGETMAAAEYDDDDSCCGDVKLSARLHGGHQHVGLKSGLLSRVRVSPSGNGRVQGTIEDDEGDEEEGEEVADCDVPLVRDWTQSSRVEQRNDVAYKVCRPQANEVEGLPPLLQRKNWTRRRPQVVGDPSSALDFERETEGSGMMTHSSSSCLSLHERCSKEVVSDGAGKVEEEEEEEEEEEDEKRADKRGEEEEKGREQMECVGERDMRAAGLGISRTVPGCRDSSMGTDSAVEVSCEEGVQQQQRSGDEKRAKAGLSGFEVEFRIRTNLDWVYCGPQEDEDEEGGCTNEDVVGELWKPCASVLEDEREGSDHEEGEGGKETADGEGSNMGERKMEKVTGVGVRGGGGLADDEPKSPPIARPIWSPQSLECPDAPYARRKRTSIGGSVELARQSSLTDTKLLLTTHLKRNASNFFYDKHFEYLHEIGRGSFSTVYEARDLRSRGVCAVKKSKRQFRGKEDRERYVREIQSVADLAEHPNVVKYFRGWQQDSYFYIQMELCEGGSLRDHLDSITELILEDKVWSWIRQVASGLAHIHKNGVLHLDIKPDNIFIDSQGTLKIGDFGLAVLGTDGDWEEGDGAYVAPELLRGKKPGPEADMYSFGAMVFEWASGERLPRSWAARQEEIKLPSQRSAALNRLVNSLLQLDCAWRPSAAAVLEWARD